MRDLVVESGQPAVFPEITNLPVGKYPCPTGTRFTRRSNGRSRTRPEFGADPSRIAVAGNSVGGDMTAALNLMAKDRKGPKISYQVLLWPATNAGVDTCSYEEYANGRFLPKAFMKYGWDLYAPTKTERENPYVSPLRASLAELRDLPPTMVITEENDVLRDEGEAYAHRLQDAGVPIVSTRYNGIIHDFGLLNALAELPTTKAMIRQVADGIRATSDRANRSVELTDRNLPKSGAFGARLPVTRSLHVQRKEWSRALASTRSRVAKPSVKRSYTPPRTFRACAVRPLRCHKRARLVALRNSQDSAFCFRLISIERRNRFSASELALSPPLASRISPCLRRISAEHQFVAPRNAPASAADAPLAVRTYSIAPPGTA